MKVEEAVGLALENRVKAFALTDINTTMGIPDFVKRAREAGITPVAGCEVRNNNQVLFIAIAKNNRGLKEINDYLTFHNLNKQPYSAANLGFNHVFVVYPPGAKTPGEMKENEFTGIRPHEVNKLLTSEYRHCLEKLVIWQPVTFCNQSSWFLHKCLRAIGHNTLIGKLTPEEFAGKNEIMVPPDKLILYYRDYPEIIRNTEKIFEQCVIDFDFSTVKNKKTFSQSEYDDKLLLEKLALDGMLYRYGKNNPVARERIRHELSIIDKLGFSSYFLITWDIIRYSISRGFYHVGRGSGANSIVAYCLRITDVDPIQLNLYFERFLNPKRSSPPDFDIDYSWKDRDDVQDYIFKRYGKDHTALLGAMSTFRDRSIIRELGKVFGLPKTEIDMMVDDPSNVLNQNNTAKMIGSLADQMMDFPNLRTIHAGGILISEEPITCYTALDLPPKNLPTTQWDMYVAEELGFEKLDILSQRGIGHIKEAVEIVQENRNVKVDIHRVNDFFNDSQVKKQLKSGETIGCFYIESPAMRGLLNKLRCDNYLTLVAASSIIRPGVSRSGMMKEYIIRFNNPEKATYIHSVMKEQLEETFGVMVYQEDVIKVAHHFAGLDLAEADVLRRAMSGKYRSKAEFKRIEEKYFDNCRRFGYPDNISREVWRQIESFAGYSFSKAHSASYAVESFQSLYLKAHYPLEFMTAVINNYGGFYQAWVYLNEAKRQGADIQRPCINTSRSVTRIIGKTIYIGFIHILNIESGTIDNILRDRECHGNFQSLADFMDRVPIAKEQLVILIRTGAFRFTAKSKAAMLWEMHACLRKPSSRVKPPTMFGAQAKNYQLPELPDSPLECAYDEFELLGFPVCVSHFDILQTSFRGEIMARELLKYVGKKVKMLGKFVTRKYVQTIKKELMHFGTFIDAEGEFFDTVHFPQSLKENPFRGDGMYLILGKVVVEFGFPSLEVERMAKLPYKANPKA
jgi:DNA polymerase-3 subunit alpha